MESETNNPYAPPVAPVQATSANFDLGEYEDAGNGKRFLNWLIDRVAMIGVIFVLFVLLSFLDESGYGEILAWMEGMNRLEEYVFESAIALLYYVVMEAAFGLTLGKLITGTRVVDESGKKPSFGAILGRSLSRFVPFEPFSFFGGNGGWHDRWSDTRVIDIRKRGARLSPALRKIYGRR